MRFESSSLSSGDLRARVPRGSETTELKRASMSLASVRSCGYMASQGWLIPLVSYGNLVPLAGFQRKSPQHTQWISLSCLALDVTR
eukprot:2498886-Amphidinium_carterae.1